MCVPILRSIGSELTKLENMQQLYILFDVTWRKNGKSGSKVMAQIMVFVFSVTLTLTFDLCSIFFVTRIAHDVLEYPCEVSL